MRLSGRGRNNSSRRQFHGYKLPVTCLDGLVAYLVKALGAVGVVTTYSCDGHGRGAVLVGLDHGCNGAWTVMLMRHVETELRLAQRWTVDDGSLTASVDRGYKEVLRRVKEMRTPYFDPFQVKLIQDDDPLARFGVVGPKLASRLRAASS